MFDLQNNINSGLNMDFLFDLDDACRKLKFWLQLRGACCGIGAVADRAVEQPDAGPDERFWLRFAQAQ